jgi:hypothetical protein
VGACSFGRAVVDSRRSYSKGIDFVVRIGLDLAKGLDGVGYFLPFSSFDPTPTKQTSIVIKPSATATISHTPSSCPSRSSSSPPHSVPSRRTASLTILLAITVSQSNTVDTTRIPHSD